MADRPTTGHSENFRGALPDGRLVNNTFDRNSRPVIDGLGSFLGQATGNALEIGSGTGQHICAFSGAFANLQWVPSEPDPVHRRSIDAWGRHLNAEIQPAIPLDAAADWAKLPEVRAISPLALILSMNVIHISPITVARGIIDGAGQCLKAGGYLVFYGPFMENNMHTGEGNRIFDARLRAENPEWGVRDLGALTGYTNNAGLVFDRMLVMPANNRLLVFRRDV